MEKIVQKKWIWIIIAALSALILVAGILAATGTLSGNRKGDSGNSSANMIVMEETTQSQPQSEFAGSGVVVPPETNAVEPDNILPERLYSTVDDLMFRTGPGTQYQALTILSRGASINVIEIKDGWVHGNYGGLDGWAYGEYLTEGGPADTKYSVYVENIKNFDIFPGMIAAGVGCDPQYRGEDDEYAYYQVYYGGGWSHVKVPKNTQNHIPEYMTDDEIAKYGINPYANTGK